MVVLSGKYIRLHNINYILCDIDDDNMFIIILFINFFILNYTI